MHVVCTFEVHVEGYQKCFAKYSINLSFYIYHAKFGPNQLCPLPDEFHNHDIIEKYTAFRIVISGRQVTQYILIHTMCPKAGMGCFFLNSFLLDRTPFREQILSFR